MTEESRREMWYGRLPCFYTFYSSTLSSERLRDYEDRNVIQTLCDEFVKLISTERIKIPVKFVRHIAEKASGLVSLMGPSGHIWHVDLTQQDDDLFFNHGWSAFVRDHLLDCGDFLVFRYNGELHFTVQLFDQSACEKEVAFHSQCSQDPSDVGKYGRLKRIRKEADSSPDTFTDGVPKKMRSFSELQLGFEEKNQELRLALFDKDGFKELNSSDMIRCGGSLPKNSVTSSKSKDLGAASVVREVQMHNGDIGNRACKEVVLGDNISLSAQDEKKVAQSFSSNFPYFVRIMKTFNTSGSFTLNIPYQFSMAHLPNCKIKIVLHNLKGESWTVNSVPSTRVHTTHTLCGGWLAFVRGNNIKVGDVCIFELVRECELLVHILGTGKVWSESRSGKDADNRVGAGFAVTSHKNFKGNSKKANLKSSKVQSKSSKKVEKSSKKGVRSRKNVSLSSNIRKRCSDANEVSVSSHTKFSNENIVIRGSSIKGDTHGLRMMLAMDEEKASKAFNSCFPSFVRIMKRFNISGSYTLKIPHQFSTAHLPNTKTEIVLHNTKGECWTVNSVPDSMGRMVHTFCGGWMAFVRGNNINIGDICIFELIGSHEMIVHISGYGKKELGYGSGEANCNPLDVVPLNASHAPL